MSQKPVLLSILIYYKNINPNSAKLLTVSYNLGYFSFFQRGSLKELINFFSRTIVQRSKCNSFHYIDEIDNSDKNSDLNINYACHLYIQANALAAVLISDKNYNKRVGAMLLQKVCENFEKEYPRNSWLDSKENSFSFPKLNDFLKDYEKPESADILCKMQSDLDETKQILHVTMEKMLEKNEKLQDLVDKSSDLSLQSKYLYKNRISFYTSILTSPYTPDETLEHLNKIEI
ncbi:Synaptobrevin YKT6 [Intoshia linei]|uniref:Synaptobrevin YKT6 n=1 Tax=Intoshia linei TaxID=1819745 RepID=A0A177B4B3_9BILA|nr:Synaptobrevin YKT6 [Intoshia linei]